MAPDDLPAGAGEYRPEAVLVSRVVNRGRSAQIRKDSTRVHGSGVLSVSMEHGQHKKGETKVPRVKIARNTESG